MQDAVDNVPDGEEVVIIGGGYLFRESVDYFNKLVLTVVDCEIDGDVFYPEIDLTDWSLESFQDSNQLNQFQDRKHRHQSRNLQLLKQVC